MNKVFGILGLTFLFGGIICGLISLGTHNWGQDIEGPKFKLPPTFPTEDRVMGLFQICGKNPGADLSLCVNFLDAEKAEVKNFFYDNDWYAAVLGCHCCAIFVLGLAIIMWLVALCKTFAGSNMYTSIFFAILAGGGFVASVCIWRFKYKDEVVKKMDEDYSFWVALIGAVVTLIGAIFNMLAAILGRRHKQ